MAEPKQIDPSAAAPLSAAAPPPLSIADQRQILRVARHGLWLLSLYVVLYGGFIALSVLQPQLMARVVFLGLNLAIVYGMGLIGSAAGLALLYLYLCRENSAR